MSNYCFFDVPQVTDPGRAALYREEVFAIIAQHGGHHVVPGGADV